MSQDVSNESQQLDYQFLLGSMSNRTSQRESVQTDVEESYDVEIVDESYEDEMSEIESESNT